MQVDYIQYMYVDIGALCNIERVLPTWYCMYTDGILLVDARVYSERGEHRDFPPPRLI